MFNQIKSLEELKHTDFLFPGLSYTLRLQAIKRVAKVTTLYFQWNIIAPYKTETYSDVDKCTIGKLDSMPEQKIILDRHLPLTTVWKIVCDSIDDFVNELITIKEFDDNQIVWIDKSKISVFRALLIESLEK